YETLTREIGDVFKTADLPEVIRTVDKHFGLETYSLKLLFRDELRKILNMILDQTLSETEGSHLQVYQQNATMMRFLSGLGIPLPDPLYASAKVALNTELRRAVSEESRVIGIPVDSAGLGFALQKRVEAIADDFREKPDDLDLLRRFEEAVGTANALPIKVLLWGAQNIYDEVLGTTYPGFLAKSRNGDEQAALWVGRFRSVGKQLSFLVPED
ncbi:MAG: DUF3536 domain-containing protein, partial [Candidatus Deferrimicrobiaceae bacterium]